MPKQVRTPEQQAYLNATKRIRNELRIAVDEVLAEVEPQVWRELSAAALEGRAPQITVDPDEARSTIRGLLNAPQDR